jgi:UDP-N-acetylglucosamine--N-acetylmuramyl-(pentapeptide) pyrophosphoryl-undecaprenol N-acetylglucosamine transferase
MRMIVAGGGTGGHLFPGLAVAEALAAQGDASILFVGSAYGLEASTIPRTRFPFRALTLRGVRGRGLRGVLAFAAHLPMTLLQSRHIVSTFQPTLVLGLGGYSSVPIAVAAWLRRVPLVLLEQNVHPGLANRLLGRLARRICTTYPQSAHFFPAGKAVHTGNPVRQMNSAARPVPDRLTLFAFGGSQGAHTINCAMVDAAPILAQHVPGVHIIHQTGAADAAWVRGRYREMGVVAEVLEFVHDMGDAYGRADLVICRAGATTLAEVTALSKPSILVPYPFAADDHQRKNAEVLRDQSAAEVILNAELSGERLAACVLELVNDRERLPAMAAAAGRLAVPDATQHVVAVCRQVEEEGRR